MWYGHAQGVRGGSCLWGHQGACGGCRRALHTTCPACRSTPAPQPSPSLHPHPTPLTWNSQRPLTSQVMQSAGWLALSRDSTPRMLSLTRGVSVRTSTPSHTGVAHAGFSPPPASTRHSRQVPGVVGRRGCVHSVGIWGRGGEWGGADVGAGLRCRGRHGSWRDAGRCRDTRRKGMPAGARALARAAVGGPAGAHGCPAALRPSGSRCPLARASHGR